MCTCEDSEISGIIVSCQFPIEVDSSAMWKDSAASLGFADSSIMISIPGSAERPFGDDRDWSVDGRATVVTNTAGPQTGQKKKQRPYVPCGLTTMSNDALP